MAAEPKRGCGYRKVGGLYLVGGELSAPCDRLPMETTICPCCGEGIKQSRAWTWIDPVKLFEGMHKPCSCDCGCPVCYPSLVFPFKERSGLLWVGEQFYPTPADFSMEAARLGVSRRISSIPRNFELGKTWVFFGHPKAIERNGSVFDEPGAARWAKGIICAFRPTRIERIVLKSEAELMLLSSFAESHLDADQLAIIRRLQADLDRGITLVPVPDDDPDHI